MLDDCFGDEQRKLPVLHEIGQQKSVLSSEGDWIKHSLADIRPGASHGKPSRIQVSNTSVRLKHVVLKSAEPQFFRSADQIGAVSDEPELEAIMLGRAPEG